MYNTNVFPHAPTSWDVVFKEMDLPDGKPNKDRVQGYVGPIYIADAALYLKTHNPELGITDPYELTQAQFDAAVDLLQEQRQMPRSTGETMPRKVEDFKTEGIRRGSLMALPGESACGRWSPIASVVPVEGATGWADTTMMATNAPHPNCAYMWLEHSIDPKVQGDVAAWFGSNPAVPAGCTSSDCSGRRAARRTAIRISTRLHFGRRRSPIAGTGRAIA